MIKYTTPTLTLTVKGVDLTGQKVYATLLQGRNKLTKNGEQLTITVVNENTVINMKLTQEESAMFDYDRSVDVQVNWISSLGVRAATKIKTICVMQNLLDEVISFGE